MMKSFFQVLRRLAALIGVTAIACTLPAAEATKVSFDVPAGDAARTLKQFAHAAHREIVFTRIGAVQTNAVKGEFTVKEALERLLAGTPLTAFEDAKTGGLVVQRRDDPNGPGVAPTATTRSPTRKSEPSENGVIKLETFEVMDSKLLNMDIPRSRDDIQPYAVFNRETIRNAGVVNVEGFFRKRLTMNAGGTASSQVSTNNGGNTSNASVNLRGLGSSQTVILIDGHRVAGAMQLGSPRQPDINAIPLEAIERIEVLPTTASGIYGGSATGGVINIVLRRDYSGAEVKLTYDNSFDSDSAVRRVDFGAGLTFENGKSSLLLTGSFSDQAELAVQDRNFVQRGRSAIVHNLGDNPINLASITAPPLGATPNIRSANGSPLFGPGTSAITYVSPGSTGSGGLAAFLPNAGRYNLDLAQTAQAYLTGGGGGAQESLLGSTMVKSVSGTFRRQFSERLQIFCELAGSENNSRATTNIIGSSAITIPATTPTNPFGQAVVVALPVNQGANATINRQQDLRALLGVIFKLTPNWTAEFDYLWTRAQFSYFGATYAGLAPSFNTALANGTLNIFRDPSLYDLSPYFTGATYLDPVRSTMRSANLRFAGTAFTLPGGQCRFPACSNAAPKAPMKLRIIRLRCCWYRPNRSRSTPSISRPGFPCGPPGPGEGSPLELQAAVRVDDYTMNAATSFVSPGQAILYSTNKARSVNPTLGLRWKPTPDVMLRASFGTGFLPPTIGQLVSTTNPTSAAASDPRRGGTPVPPFQVISGGNPDVRPDKSESWSGGVVLTPAFVHGLRIALDYTRITKTDAITALTVQQVLDLESLFPSRVVRGTNLPGDPVGWAGPVTTLNTSVVNLSRAEIEAYDLAVDYTRSLGIGEISVYAGATWQPHYETQVLPISPVIENAGVGTGLGASYPIKLRANAGITGRRDGLTVGWNMQYLDSYLLVNPTLTTFAALSQRQGSTKVASQIYHDVFVGYRIPMAAAGSRRLLQGTEMQVGVNNIFNQSPPLDVSNTRYFYSTLGSPRLASYYVSVKRSF